MNPVVCDPRPRDHLIAARRASGLDRYDEVWSGDYVMPPAPNNEHQVMVARLVVILMEILQTPVEGQVFPGTNISDRTEGWQQNFRIPDVAVFLPGNAAQDCDTHWCGGPDWLAEIISEGDRTREKLEFYAHVGVREVTLIDRDPWCVELYRLDQGELKLAGNSSVQNPDVLKSAVLPLSFQLVVGKTRPLLQASHVLNHRQWFV